MSCLYFFEPNIFAFYNKHNYFLVRTIIFSYYIRERIFWSLCRRCTCNSFFYYGWKIKPVLCKSIFYNKRIFIHKNLVFFVICLSRVCLSASSVINNDVCHHFLSHQWSLGHQSWRVVSNRYFDYFQLGMRRHF